MWVLLGLNNTIIKEKKYYIQLIDYSCTIFFRQTCWLYYILILLFFFFFWRRIIKFFCKNIPKQKHFWANERVSWLITASSVVEDRSHLTITQTHIASWTPSPKMNELYATRNANKCERCSINNCKYKYLFIFKLFKNLFR